jgi:hypothetical protein
VRPTIIGPPTCRAADPPPGFRIDTAGLLYMVELAATGSLMATVPGRTRDNYFFGGDSDNAFATGPFWCVPPPVWARLRRTRILYYRVVAIDQSSGTSCLSVADDNLQTLPSITVEDAPSGDDRADRQERR